MLIPAASANTDVVGFVIGEHSQIANILASPDIRKSGNAICDHLSHYANMAHDNGKDGKGGKNGGPNHLFAWMDYRNTNGAKLSKALDITPGMVSDLANSKRALSAKWLRRLAPALRTTPGMLLDHDPREIDADILEIWVSANPEARRKIVEHAKIVMQDYQRNAA